MKLKNVLILTAIFSGSLAFAETKWDVLVRDYHSLVGVCGKKVQEGKNAFGKAARLVDSKIRSWKQVDNGCDIIADLKTVVQKEKNEANAFIQQVAPLEPKWKLLVRDCHSLALVCAKRMQQAARVVDAKIRSWKQADGECDIISDLKTVAQKGKNEANSLIQAVQSATRSHSGCDLFDRWDWASMRQDFKTVTEVC